MTDELPPTDEQVRRMRDRLFDDLPPAPGVRLRRRVRVAAAAAATLGFVTAVVVGVVLILTPGGATPASISPLGIGGTAAAAAGGVATTDFLCFAGPGPSWQAARYQYPAGTPADAASRAAAALSGCAAPGSVPSPDTRAPNPSPTIQAQSAGGVAVVPTACRFVDGLVGVFPADTTSADAFCSRIGLTAVTP